MNTPSSYEEAREHPVFRKRYSELIVSELDPALQGTREAHGYGQMWKFGVPGDYGNEWHWRRFQLGTILQGKIEDIMELELSQDKSDGKFYGNVVRNLFKPMQTFMERYAPGDAAMRKNGVVAGSYPTIGELYNEPDTAPRYALFDLIVKDVNQILKEMERGYNLFKADIPERERYRTLLVDYAKELVGLLGAISIHRFPSPVSLIHTDVSNRIAFAFDWNSEIHEEDSYCGISFRP